MKNSDLQSGSREICFLTKLWSSQYPGWNSSSKRIHLSQGPVLRKIKGCQRELAAVRSSNMGIMSYWLVKLLITWGLPAHIWSITVNIPLDRLNDTLMVTWGLPTHIWSIAVNIPLDRLNATLMVTWGLPAQIWSIVVNIPLGPACTPCLQSTWGLPVQTKVYSSKRTYDVG